MKHSPGCCFLLHSRVPKKLILTVFASLLISVCECVCGGTQFGSLTVLFFYEWCHSSKHSQLPSSLYEPLELVPSSQARARFSWIIVTVEYKTPLHFQDVTTYEKRLLPLESQDFFFPFIPVPSCSVYKYRKINSHTPNPISSKYFTFLVFFSVLSTIFSWLAKEKKVFLKNVWLFKAGMSLVIIRKKENIKHFLKVTGKVPSISIPQFPGFLSLLLFRKFHFGVNLVTNYSAIDVLMWKAPRTVHRKFKIWWCVMVGPLNEKYSLYAYWFTEVTINQKNRI